MDYDHIGTAEVFTEFKDDACRSREGVLMLISLLWFPFRTSQNHAILNQLLALISRDRSLPPQFSHSLLMTSIAVGLNQKVDGTSTHGKTLMVLPLRTT